MTIYNIEIFADKIIVKKIKGRKYIIELKDNKAFKYACKKYGEKPNKDILSIGNVLKFESGLNLDTFKELIRLLNKAKEKEKLVKHLIDIYFKRV